MDSKNTNDEKKFIQHCHQQLNTANITIIFQISKFFLLYFLILIIDNIIYKKESADYSTDPNTNDEKKFFNNISSKTVL